LEDSQKSMGLSVCCYDVDSQVTNDIALLKLARDVEFIPLVLEPVCLPLTFDKFDVVKKGRLTQHHVNKAKKRKLLWKNHVVFLPVWIIV